MEKQKGTQGQKGTQKGFLITVIHKVVQFALVVIVINLFTCIVSDKFYDKTDKNKPTTLKENNDSSSKDSINKGVIYTDAKTETKSSYTVSNGYSKFVSNENNIKKLDKNSVNNKNKKQITSTYKIDKSSLKGNNISILEGEVFDPIKDLNLKATDKDGKDIRDKIVIESNCVDSNKPGNYTVTVSLRLKDGNIIRKTFYVTVKEIKLEINLNSFKPEKYIVEKNERITLDLNISTSKKDVIPTYAMINGEEYPLYKDSNNILSKLLNKANYKVNVKSEEEAGIKEYKISYIKMSDGTLINLEKSTSVEVLKSQAQIKNFYCDKDPLGKSIIVKFDLEDIDNSASSLNIEVCKDEELVYSKKLDKKSKYEINIPIKSKGLYNVKILGDINLSSDKNNEVKNKEIFCESINITNMDESSITGNNIELTVGYKFDPIKDLKLKAIDIDGEDITDKIVVDNSNVDTNTVGEYKVLVHVVNTDNKNITGEFTVVVQNDLSSMSKIARLFGIENRKTKVSRSSTFTNSTNNIVVTGNDSQALTSNVYISGLVSKKDGEMPNGKLYVELPTSLSFSVDKNGAFIGGSYLIDNKSSCDVELLVGDFMETDKDGGITVRSLDEDIKTLDRSNVHLYLKGDNIVDLGKKITNDKPLIIIGKSNTRSVQLLGDAGKGVNDKVDRDGVHETFSMLFKIRKKD